MSRVYTTKGLPPPPDVSLTTKPIAGLLTDIYGLAELAPNNLNQGKGKGKGVTCLWLMHPRGSSRAAMGDFARRAVHAWSSSTSPSSSRVPPSASPGRGLIALAFDMPNHGSRLVSPEANTAWSDGNDLHALDLAGMVQGGVKDLAGAMDLVAGYLGVRVEGHVVLGWSMGGHAAWQTFFNERRVDAAVVVVGCPDFMGLMNDRAKETKLGGEGFLGGPFFPPDLIASCLAHDPKGILFGMGEIHRDAPAEERARLRSVLDQRVRGKKLLLCSGGADELVPYAKSRPFVEFLKEYHDVTEVVDKVYDGVGHKFSAGMVTDALAFVMERVREGPREARPRI